MNLFLSIETDGLFSYSSILADTYIDENGRIKVVNFYSPINKNETFFVNTKTYHKLNLKYLNDMPFTFLQKYSKNLDNYLQHNKIYIFSYHLFKDILTGQYLWDKLVYKDNLYNLQDMAYKNYLAENQIPALNNESKFFSFKKSYIYYEDIQTILEEYTSFPLIIKGYQSLFLYKFLFNKFNRITSFKDLKKYVQNYIDKETLDKIHKKERVFLDVKNIPVQINPCQTKTTNNISPMLSSPDFSCVLKDSFPNLLLPNMSNNISDICFYTKEKILQDKKLSNEFEYFINKLKNNDNEINNLEILVKNLNFNNLIEQIDFIAYYKNKSGNNYNLAGFAFLNENLNYNLFLNKYISPMAINFISIFELNGQSIHFTNSKVNKIIIQEKNQIYFELEETPYYQKKFIGYVYFKDKEITKKIPVKCVKALDPLKINEYYIIENTRGNKNQKQKLYGTAKINYNDAGWTFHVKFSIKEGEKLISKEIAVPYNPPKIEIETTYIHTFPVNINLSLAYEMVQNKEELYLSRT